MAIDITVGAKRYDGGSASASFIGCVPLKRGQLLEANLDRIQLLEGVADVPVSVSTLYPRHKDGSVKVIVLNSTFALNSGTQRDMILRIRDTANPSITVVGDAGISGVNKAWMEAPTLIGCTDPYHLCATKITPMPLIPLNHPNMDARWKDFLSLDFENSPHGYAFPTWLPWIRDLDQYGKIVQTANNNHPANAWQGGAIYNALSTLYYSYMITGDLDKLRRAHLVACGGQGAWGGWPDTWVGIAGGTAPDGGVLNGTWNPGNGIVKYAAAYDGHAVDENWIGDEFGAPSRDVATAEWSSGIHQDTTMCYLMSGWRHVLGVMVHFGTRHFWPGPSNPTSLFIPPLESPFATGQSYGARQTHRSWRDPTIFFAMLDMPMALKRFGTTFPPARSFKQQYRNYFQRNIWEVAESWSDQISAANLPHGLLHGFWGCSVGYDNEQTVYPNGLDYGPTNFNAHIPWETFLFTYMHIVEHPNYLTKLGEFVTWYLDTQVKGPYNVTYPLAQSLYAAPYMVYDPAFISEAPTWPPFGNFYSVAMNIGMLAQAYRITGDPRLLTILNTINRNHSALYNGTSGVGANLKQLGEYYHAAFAAAAWMANDPEFSDWGVVSEAGGPILITGAQIIELHTPLQGAAEGGDVVANLTFNRALSRVAGYHDRVKNGDPSTARLIWLLLAATGLEADSVLKDKDTVAELLSGTTNEITNTGYARIVVAAASLTTATPDDTNDRQDLDIADPLWAAVDIGDAVAKIVLAYAPDSAGADSTFILLDMWDFAAVPNGGPIQFIINAAGYHRAQQA